MSGVLPIARINHIFSGVGNTLNQKWFKIDIHAPYERDSSFGQRTSTISRIGIWTPNPSRSMVIGNTKG